MENRSHFSQGILRLGGGNWSEAQCVEKVEEMLSRAIMHQEDLWGMMMLHSPDPGASAMGGTELVSNQIIPPMVLRGLMAKLENSMDWCHLALCRLKEILSNSPCPPPASLARSALARFRNYEPKAEPQLIVKPPSSKLKQHTALSPIHVPFREENLASSPHPLTGLQGFSCFSAGKSGPSTVAESPWSYLFAGTPKAAAASAATDDQSVLTLESFGLHESHQGQHSAEEPVFLMDSDTWAADISEALVSKFTDPGRVNLPRETSFSCRVDAPAPSCSAGNVAEEANRLEAGRKTENSETIVLESRVEASTASHSDLDRSRRNPNRQKRERDAPAEEEKSEVQYQCLRPGMDMKKGIPDDGHRGWKKYGNKAIQNANFCRGYYKCSVKDCNAKKMVQPTDKDPSMFEVTYVGKHTCSSTYPRKRQPRAKGMAAMATLAAGDQAQAACSSDPNAETSLLGAAGTPEITDIVSSMQHLPSSIMSNMTAESLSEQWQAMGSNESARTTTTTGGSDLESVEGRGSTESSSWSSDEDWRNFSPEDGIYSYLNNRNSDQGAMQPRYNL